MTVQDTTVRIQVRNLDLPYVQSDGGRADAGFKGAAGDCGVRCATHVICAAQGGGTRPSGRLYRQVYDDAKDLKTMYVTGKPWFERAPKAKQSRLRSPRNGLYVPVMDQLLRLHLGDQLELLRPGSAQDHTQVLKWRQARGDHYFDSTHPWLQQGYVVTWIRNHYAAVLDGVTFDTWDTQRDWVRRIKIRQAWRIH